MRLEGKVAIVTGGSQGIGKGVAELFGREGAKVVIADINEAVGEETMKELENQGVQVFFKKTDVSNEESVINLITYVVKNFGRVDILVNNAAITYRKAVHETSLDEWKKLIDINLTGAFLCSKYTIPEMQKQSNGSIINMASTHAETTITRLAAYASAKGGLTALTRQMALDYGKDQIRVNAVGPGSVDTLMLQKTYEDLDNPEESFRQTLEFNPMGRLGTVKDIANVCLFLASNESTYVNGQTIFVDGGQINKFARPISFD